MSFLLDTNVISEPMKPQPEPNVLRWLADVDEDRVFISVITLAELRSGVERLAAGARRTRLETWLLDELPLRFEGRILTIDASVADTCGRVVARCHALGRPIEAMDAFIAATAEVYRLTLVTRDASHFQTALKSVLNPWTQPPA
ncbi:MAG TPA: type II toxin-antitoxin system VapC family toxin [Candidatus Angelobacter sp.]|nr:type II toxin-antitoxin system VapC family toxin [Candidatus Angelobacter sp.]